MSDAKIAALAERLRLLHKENVASIPGGEHGSVYTEAAAALEALQKERDELREICAAAAADYRYVVERLHNAGLDGTFPKSIADMLDTASLMERAVKGESVWPEFQTEFTKAMQENRALQSRLKEAEEALRVFAECAKELEGSEDVPRAPDGEWAKFRLLTDDYRKAAAVHARLSTATRDEESK